MSKIYQLVHKNLFKYPLLVLRSIVLELKLVHAETLCVAFLGAAFLLAVEKGSGFLTFLAALLFFPFLKK